MARYAKMAITGGSIAEGNEQKKKKKKKKKKGDNVKSTKLKRRMVGVDKLSSGGGGVATPRGEQRFKSF